MLEAYVHFVGDDGGEGGFAEAGRAEEEDVVEGFAAGFGGFEGDGQLLLGFVLADEFAEPAGAELEFEAVFFAGAGGAYQAFGIVFGRIFGVGGHAEGSLTGGGLRGKRSAWGGRLSGSSRHSSRLALPLYWGLHCW